jgi:hypothetical protein
MAITKEKLAQLDQAIDEWLKLRALDPDDCMDDEDEDQENILNPLAAPQKFGDGEHGGPPEQIHKSKDLFS